ncbi:mechanosensitive ion channel family protein [Mangrovibacterium lignilyticum]|uniref:mechanosensitive ion channel family protein n=1 Tax=Mangrovibacterium lignilyticum TaxID=2668052 RepID=UPI0013D4735E|nr:mechanosensitive ion channel domain-containing protein [Mangrovibacterium lignilyticum]
MKALLTTFITVLLFASPYVLQAQTNSPAGDSNGSNDSTIVKERRSYKAAEIAYEIENINRDIKEGYKKIESYQQISEIDSTFSNLCSRIEIEYREFNNFDQQNLSKFFLINKKRVWSSYRSQLNSWQVELANRLQYLMEISDKVRRKESLWTETSNISVSKKLPQEITTRILNTIDKLQELQTNLYEAVEQIAVLDSRVIDQTIEVDEYIGTIEELHKSYRKSLLKATQPLIWNIKLKDTFDGTISARLQKAWYENSKSIKDSLPAFKEYFDNFIIWIIIIILSITSLRYLYFKQNPSKRSSEKTNINELVIWHPAVSVFYLSLFIFFLLFKNIPLALSGFVSLTMLVITYFLLRSYINAPARRLILTFIPLLAVNIGEIVFWYFGNYARLYLFFEAGLGIVLISYFMSPDFTKKIAQGFRYKVLLNLLRYPVFILYGTGFILNVLGYQNLAIFLLKIGTHISYAIIIIVGAWEITKSSLYTLFEVLTRFEKYESHEYFPMFKKRLLLLLSLFFALVGFHTLLLILEMDTPFYNNLERFMGTERNVGSFIFTYQAIFQFAIIMLITWAIVTIIKIAFSEGNFKRTQRLRGVPAAISITLRLVIALGGFLFALSVAGVDLTKISIMLGAFSVGIGFGLQNIVNNFISGLILIYERPIQAGDTIEINTLMGEVKKIGIRSSRVRTFDGAEVIVPNAILVSDQLINWTLSDEKRRIEIVIGVKYGTDPEEVIRILKGVANDHELVSKFPEPQVLFNEFADSALNFRLLCWVLFQNGIKVKSELSVAIDKVFKENRIEIPFPQLDLHVLDIPADKTQQSDKKLPEKE